ncbi:MAG: hypothetical protein JO332_18670 [Planctomycetaceae bacterium]|nr:hypothetical protein [Planctomycetaceae bacterium]
MMKTLMILGLGALLSSTGCSSNHHMLEPGHDKGAAGVPEKGFHACCNMTDCRCGNCQETAACGCKHESNIVPPSGPTP